MTPTDEQILARLTHSPYLAYYALPLGAQKIRAFVVKAKSNTSNECANS